LDWSSPVRCRADLTLSPPRRRRAGFLFLGINLGLDRFQESGSFFRLAFCFLLNRCAN